MFIAVIILSPHFAWCLTIARTAFERVYRAQKDARAKERMLLVLNVVYYGKVAAHVTREIHKSKGWACQWLKRYREKGLEGLMDRPKGGRHSQMSEQTEYKIKTMLKESSQGWTTKQVEEVIIQESGVRYHHLQKDNFGIGSKLILCLQCKCHMSLC